MMDRKFANTFSDLGEDKLGLAIEIVLAALLAFMPLAFGAVHAWSEQVFIAAVGLIAVLFAVKVLFDRNFSVNFSLAIVPVGIFLLLVAGQLLPLSSAAVELISPGTAALKTELLSQVPGANTDTMTISFYPWATMHNLRLITALAVMFFIIANTYRSVAQVKRLLLTIAFVGAAIALLAILQIISRTDKIYWHIPSPGHEIANAGTFVNHSHFSQFINLSMGAALGYLLIFVHDHFKGRKLKVTEIFELLGSQHSRIFWALCAAMIISTVAVFLSLSRGGVVSLLVSAIFITILLTFRARGLSGFGWILAVLAMAAFACILYSGFDAVYDRLATVHDIDEYKGRWQMVKDVIVAWRQFPVFGTGLGTHQFVYPMFDRAVTKSIASHAENEYIQLANETGLIGLVSLLALGGLVIRYFVKNITRPASSAAICSYGLAFGLIAILIHSFSDFGQHIPANSLLSVIFCGILASLALNKKDMSQNQSTHAGKICAGILVVISASALGYFAFDLNNVRKAEKSWDKALAAEKLLQEKNWQGTSGEFRNLIQNASLAYDSDQGNVTYRHWLNAYRWLSMTNSGSFRFEKLPPQFTAVAAKIRDQFYQTIELCPVYGPSWCVAGQIDYFVLGNPDAADLIRTGYQLAPNDPTACFVAGYLEASAGNMEKSLPVFSKSVALDGRFFKDIAGIYIEQFARPQLAIELAGDDIGKLSFVNSVLYKYQQFAPAADELTGRIYESLMARANKTDTPAWIYTSLAEIYRRQGKTDQAIEYYRKALDLEYSQINWRIQLARLLADQSSFDQAIHEARICLRLRPNYPAAERLIQQWSVEK